MSTYKALRKNASAPRAPADQLAALRELALAAPSDNMHRNIGTVGLQPCHKLGEKTMAGTRWDRSFIDALEARCNN